ncbi:MoaD/ThiS family protein [Bacillus sp. T3]|uniref:MoaD/ThiS family protein n=1 Tax=Bacillus sp. T3 TaxID=467262 RepID=UPI002980C18A|nr:MoaD/ThiS family protein [Bacillus sp. T3]
MNKILFFAQLRDVVGKDSVYMDLSGKTISEVKTKLLETYPALKLDSAMVAVNEEFAGNEEINNTQDEIAFISPVSGG